MNLKQLRWRRYYSFPELLENKLFDRPSYFCTHLTTHGSVTVHFTTLTGNFLAGLGHLNCVFYCLNCPFKKLNSILTHFNCTLYFLWVYFAISNTYFTFLLLCFPSCCFYSERKPRIITSFGISEVSFIVVFYLCIAQVQTQQISQQEDEQFAARTFFIVKLGIVPKEPVAAICYGIFPPGRRGTVHLWVALIS